MSNAILVIKKVFLFFSFGNFTKMRSTKFPPVKVNLASPKTTCHKIQWLQFANKNIAGLQFWHSSIHFQIPINPAISTLHLRLGTHYNFGLRHASTTICEGGFSKQIWVKGDHKSRLKLETLDALMRASLCSLPMENMDWARIFDI